MMKAKSRGAARGGKVKGFTLVEIMIVVSIIGLLSAIAVPAFIKARRNAQATRVANDLRVFVDGFRLYSLEEGAFPPEAVPGALPPGMSDYFDTNTWTQGTPGGAVYQWHYCAFISQFIVYILGESDVGLMSRVDEILDDGQEWSGEFQNGGDSNYFLIVREG